MSGHGERYSVRPATEADLPAVLTLYAETGLDDGVRLDLPLARERFVRFASYPFYRLYVVTSATEGIVGTYVLLVMDNIAHLGAPLAVVEQVAVANACQGQGLGTLMMEHAMAHARQHGCYKLALSSNVKRERAHDFYDKLGFTRHGYSFHIDLSPRTLLETFDD